MKKIYNQLLDFYKNDLKITYFLCVVVFLAICISVNYTYFSDTLFIRIYKHEWFYPFIVLLFYGIPYFTAFILYAYFYSAWHLFKNPTFWIPVSVAIFSLVLNESFYLHKTWINSTISDVYINYFATRCSTELKNSIFYFIPVLIYWKFFEPSKQVLYGFGLSKFDVKPYLWMLIIMFPFLFWASTTPDFKNDYPIYNDGGFSDVVGIPEWISIVLFESFYGFDFIFLEFFFRGFMVLALVEVVGIHGVIPMATLYCVFHFGKPVGETISSFFGGTLLGIVAFHSRSIYGGVLVHWGIAFMMEVLGIWQKY